MYNVKICERKALRWKQLIFAYNFIKNMTNGQDYYKITFLEIGSELFRFIKSF